MNAVMLLIFPPVAPAFTRNVILQYKRYVKIKLIRTLLFIFCVSLLPRGQAQEIRLTADARIPDGAVSSPVMDAGTFAYCALVASGTENVRLEPLLQRLDAVFYDFERTLGAESGSERTAEAALLFLYDSVIDSYQENQTRLDTLLENGTYNCVSSTVLYMYLMKRCGINVTAVEAPYHAFCTVSAGDRRIDVETTNPYGFNPGQKKEMPSADNSKKYYVVPARNYRGRHSIDDRAAVALIYGNRVTALEKKKCYGEAVGLAVDVWKLRGGSEEAEDFLMGRVANTIAALQKAKEAERALEFSMRAYRLFGASDGCRKNSAAALGDLLNGRLKEKDFSAAVAVTEQYRCLITDADYHSLVRVTVLHELKQKVEMLPFDESAQAVRNARSQISAKDYQSMLVYAYSEEIGRTAAAGNYLEAASLAERGLREFPKEPSLTRLRDNILKNYAAGVHNQAVPFLQNGDLDSAERIISEGLEQFENSALLRNDLNQIQKMRRIADTDTGSR